MKPCLDCGAPAPGPRCGVHQRAWEATRKDRHPQRKAYTDPAYRAYRAVVLAARPRCHLCGGPGADTLDHVVPLTAGGTNQPSNLRPAHRACNVRKHDASA